MQDQLIAAHTDIYLGSIRRKCFLDEEGEDLHSKMMAVLASMREFVAVERRALNTLLADAAADADAVFGKLHETSAAFLALFMAFLQELPRYRHVSLRFVYFSEFYDKFARRRQ